MVKRTAQASPGDPAEESGAATVTSVTTHVGPTLEAEGRLDDVLGDALPWADQQPAGDDSIDRLTVVKATSSGEPEETSEAETGENLRTRLPGDTSSDPHTDLP